MRAYINMFFFVGVSEMRQPRLFTSRRRKKFHTMGWNGLPCFITQTHTTCSMNHSSQILNVHIQNRYTTHAYTKSYSLFLSLYIYDTQYIYIHIYICVQYTYAQKCALCEVNNCNRLDVHSQSPSGCCSDSSGIYRNHWLRLASLRATSGLDKTLTI